MEESNCKAEKELKGKSKAKDKGEKMAKEKGKKKKKKKKASEKAKKRRKSNRPGETGFDWRTVEKKHALYAKEQYNLKADIILPFPEHHNYIHFDVFSAVTNLDGLVK